MKVIEKLYLDTRENKLYTYDNAVQKEVEYEREGYEFSDWLSEDYNVVNLYNLFKEDGDADKTIVELKKEYGNVLLELAENELNHAEKDFGDWRVYEVEK